jgi:hypothetical protein
LCAQVILAGPQENARGDPLPSRKIPRPRANRPGGTRGLPTRRRGPVGRNRPRHAGHFARVVRPGVVIWRCAKYKERAPATGANRRWGSFNSPFAKADLPDKVFGRGVSQKTRTCGEGVFVRASYSSRLAGERKRRSPALPEVSSTVGEPAPAARPPDFPHRPALGLRGPCLRARRAAAVTSATTRTAATTSDKGSGRRRCASVEADRQSNSRLRHGWPVLATLANPRRQGGGQ